jgi:hypothetical protein
MCAAQRSAVSASTLQFLDFRRLVARFLSDHFKNDRLQEAFGYDCVDSGEVPGRLGHDPDVFFESRLGFSVMPPERTVPDMEPDELFDFIEVLHDLVSLGGEETGYHHTYSACGWHFREFSPQPAQQELRDTLNPLLARLEPPLELTQDGLIEDRAPDELQPLLDASLPASAPVDDVTSRVEAAVKRYRRSRGNIDDRKAAVRELADVLEFLRGQLKESMLSADGRALFNLANNFGIRHHNRSQRGDYDKDVWLEWVFYVYLASIHAVVRVVEQQRGSV